MQRNDKVDIVIIVGPDNPGSNETQIFLQEKLKQRIAYFKEQGLSCKVIGNGKDAVRPEELANLPKAQCVVVCGHGSLYQKDEQSQNTQSHRIGLYVNTPDTNNLIENIQAQTGAKQFILASCMSGKVNENFQNGKDSVKTNSEVLALSPPDEATEIRFSLNAVLHAINEFGTNKRNNKDTNLSKIYADLLKASPNAISYGVQAKKKFAATQFDPKELMYFTEQNANFIAENRGNTLTQFKNFLKDNGCPALSTISDEKMSDSKKYEQVYMDNLIRLGDLASISKIVEKSPQMMNSASLNIYHYSHLMDIMRSWANDDNKYMAMTKLLANFDMDHGAARNLQSLFASMKGNYLPPANKHFLKCALIDLSCETKDQHKLAYLVQSLTYAEGSRLFEGIDQNRAAMLHSRLDPGLLEHIRKETLKDACNYAMKRLEQDPNLTLKTIQQELSGNLANISWFVNRDMRKEMSNMLYNYPKFSQLQIQNMQTNTGKYQLSDYGELKPNKLMDDKNKANSSNSSANLLSKLGSKRPDGSEVKKLSMDEQLSGITKAETKRSKPIEVEAPEQKNEFTTNNNNDSRTQIRVKK